MSKTKILGQTKKCIYCGKPAKKWGGYVIVPKAGSFLAGWCSQRCLNRQGFHGYYVPWMGHEGIS